MQICSGLPSCSGKEPLELGHKEDWALKNWCFRTVVLEKTLESSLDYKEIQPVNPKGDQLWIFIGRTDAEAEASMLWPPDANNWLTGKESDAGEDWGQKAKGATEDEMASPTQWTWVWANSGRWWRQGSLVCCSPRDRKESDTTEHLNNNIKLRNNE